MLRSPAPHVVFCACAVLLAIASAREGHGGEILTVRVESGRTYAGVVDAKTDGRRLWLRREQGTGMLRRGLDWEQIVAASLDGRAIPRSELPALARQIATAPKMVASSSRGAAVMPPDGKRPTPAALEFDAAVANWDADVDSDGLMLDLRLLDEEGYETTADGTLEVELFAPRLRKYHEAPQSRGYYVDLIERWTVRVSASQFRGGAARVRLPFGAVHPEFDRRVDALGLVHARLAVPGAGVLEQSVDGISLRHFAPTRDALLDNTGRWFVPTEATGQGEGTYPLPRY